MPKYACTNKNILTAYNIAFLRVEMCVKLPKSIPAESPKMAAIKKVLRRDVMDLGQPPSDLLHSGASVLTRVSHGNDVRANRTH